MINKKIVYVDMDNVLVDFQSGIDKLTEKQRIEYDGRLDEVSGIFSLMSPLKNAVESFEKLSVKYDTYILSTSPWENDTAASDKVKWVKKYLGKSAYKKLILSHNKNLNKGDYIIDDRTKNGVDKFEGEHIHFGQKDFPDWEAVCRYLL
jgi:5'-nucleotidase